MSFLSCINTASLSLSRYYRQRRYNALYVCGIDEFGVGTESMALEEQLTIQELCDKGFETHRRLYKWFHIEIDAFGRTNTSTHTRWSWRRRKGMGEKKDITLIITIIIVSIEYNVMQSILSVSFSLSFYPG